MHRGCVEVEVVECFGNLRRSDVGEAGDQPGLAGFSSGVRADSRDDGRSFQRNAQIRFHPAALTLLFTREPTRGQCVLRRQGRSARRARLASTRGAAMWWADGAIARSANMRSSSSARKFRCRSSALSSGNSASSSLRGNVHAIGSSIGSIEVACERRSEEARGAVEQRHCVFLM